MGISNITLGLCDDREEIHENVNTFIVSFSKGRGIKVEVVHFYSARQLLESKAEMEAIFLDIDMPQMDGIEAGRILRKRGIKSKIIMLTGCPERFREAFEIEAYRFLVKPLDKTEFEKAIDDVIYSMVASTEVLVHNNGTQYKVAQRDILYVEANESSTLIFTSKSEFRSEKSLSEWETILDERLFFRCHKSFVVNLGKIEDIQDNIIKMCNGDKVAVSRRLKKPLQYAYMTYDTKWR